MTSAAPSPTMMLIALLGGIGLFLLGMTMLTDGLKLAAGRALERILAAWTRTRLHGLITGILLTALVQSSTAMTVAAIGFVNAGLLTFSSALWVVFGSNLGSSVTGWLVAWIGFKMKIDAFALPFIGIGMALKLTGSGTRRAGLGMALAGFGVLFLGIDMLKNGFAGLGPESLPQLGNDWHGVSTAMLIGLALTIVLQASSATLTLVLTAVAGGMMTVEVGAGMVIGANVGTTLTGILAAIGATANARRLAAAHVFFNAVTAVVAMALLSPLLGLIHAISVGAVGSGDAVTQLVVFHTAFNFLGVLLMWPLSRWLVPFLLARFGKSNEDLARPRYLDRNVTAVPVLALQALRRELARMGHLAVQLGSHATRLNPLALPWAAAPAHADQQLARELETVEHLQRAIGHFVGELSRQPMPLDVSSQLPELLRIATHFDTLARVMHHVGLQGWHMPRPEPATASPGPSLLILPNALQQILTPTNTPTAAMPADTAHASGDHPHTPSGDIVACVVPVFQAALDFFTAADPEGEQQGPGNEWLLAEARDSFEDSYQAAKAALLHAGAGGAVEVSAVYDWLARLSDLRRAVEQGYKAAERLARLSDLAPVPQDTDPMRNPNAPA
ncbi:MULTISPECIES: Na/Pi cotransporter family protein [Giesbergeria]|uniref:Na/Pi cotransporter family protein n=1 Tax=Giesbergeria sinuosa TaxID=80883 RepID=A0ABV9QCL0_9BURK